MYELASPAAQIPSAGIATLPRFEQPPRKLPQAPAPRTATGDGPDPRLATLRPKGNRSLAYRVAKRAMDLVGALSLVVLLSPVLLVTLLVLLVTTKGRPFYVQRRVGLCGREFPMFKFRTMCLNAESKQHLVLNEQSGPMFKNRRDPRITPIGRILRRLSIDEMPQLFNVIAGHMALVGPRPGLMSEVRRMTWQIDRVTVKPGLTCLWQVSGRCEIGFDEWMTMDLWYVQHQCLATDLKLLWKTPLSVISGRGAY